MLAIALVVMLGQCSKDTECKGERICVEGRCVAERLTPEPKARSHDIELLEAQRPSLYAPISTLIVGFILETVAGVLFAVGAESGAWGGIATIGVGTLIGGGISLGTTIWARSRVGRMIEALER